MLIVAHLHTRFEQRPSGNRFVDALPPAVAAALTRNASLRVFAEGETLARRGEAIECVYFPVSGAIAHLEEHGDGKTAEVAAVGRDGVSAFEALLGEPRAQFTRVAEVPLSAFVAEVGRLRSLYDDSPPFQALLRRYAVASMRIAGISAACERHHLIAPRLASWLLRLYDHAGPAELAVTHDRAARMLGVRRAGITRASAEIAASGAIRWNRGMLSLRDPAALAGFACICRAEERDVLETLYAGTPAS
ncbi:MAG: Crp/Fnr family transcriptional regulator [Candidatus Elarobacter sp.]